MTKSPRSQEQPEVLDQDECMLPNTSIPSLKPVGGQFMQSCFAKQIETADLFDQHSSELTPQISHAVQIIVHHGPKGVVPTVAGAPLGHEEDQRLFLHASSRSLDDQATRRAQSIRTG